MTPAQPTPFSNVASPTDIAQKRKLAMALMQSGTDTSPVGHWTQALARAVQGGVGGYQAQQASQQEKGRQDAIAQALAGSGTFGGLSESDRAIMANSPEIMQSVASKTMANRLDPNAGLNKRLLEAKIKNAEAGGEQPSNVREWQYFNNLTSEQKQQYLTMKRSEKYLDLGDRFSRPNPVDPTNPVAVIPKNLIEKEVKEGEGKNIAKVRGDLAENKQRVNLAVGALTRLKQTTESLEAQPGLGNIVGGLYQALAPDVSTGSLNARTELENLKVKISGTVLQAMRDASKTGGAVGQVTEKEWPRLENMIANLDPRQGKDQFLRNLREIRAYSEQVQKAIEEAYQADVRVAEGGANLMQQPVGQPAPPAQSGGWSIKRLD